MNLDELLAKATKGPWIARGDRYDDIVADGIRVAFVIRKANSELIVRAVNTLPLHRRAVALLEETRDDVYALWTHLEAGPHKQAERDEVKDRLARIDAVLAELKEQGA